MTQHIVQNPQHVNTFSASHIVQALQRGDFSTVGVMIQTHPAWQALEFKNEARHFADIAIAGEGQRIHNELERIVFELESIAARRARR